MQTVTPDAKGRVNLGRFLAQGETWAVQQVEAGVLRLSRLVLPEEVQGDGQPGSIAGGFNSWSELGEHLDRAAKDVPPDGRDAVEWLLEDRRRRKDRLEGGR